MTAAQNRQFKLLSRPVGLVMRENFELVTAPVPEPGPGEVLVKVLYLSLDPAMRGWMNEGRSYVPPVGLGEVMRAGGVGRVVAAKDPSLAVGDFVSGMTGLQEYVVAKAKYMKKLDPNLAPLPRYLGALGAPGMTAYFGLLDVGSWPAARAHALFQKLGSLAKGQCRTLDPLGVVSESDRELA